VPFEKSALIRFLGSQAGIKYKKRDLTPGQKHLLSKRTVKKKSLFMEALNILR
jgi:hypothetical protein